MTILAQVPQVIMPKFFKVGSNSETSHMSSKLGSTIIASFHIAQNRTRFLHEVALRCMGVSPTPNRTFAKQG